jgi:hypothetical protein
MRDIVNSPFFLRFGARMRGPAEMQVGALRRVLISNVMVHNADSHFSTLISGLRGHDIEDVKFNNIRIYYRPIDSPAARIQTTVPEYEKAYPEPQKFGVMPAYGFFIRHVKNIEMNNVEISYLGKETRPAFIMDDVKGADLINIKAQRGTNAPSIILRNVENITMDKVRGIPTRTIPRAAKMNL